MVSFGIAILVVVVCFFAYLVLTKSQQETVFSGGGYAPASSCSSKGGKNNPGYLIHTSTTWKGKEDSSGCKFENFSSMRYGIRAWFVNLFGKINNGTITNTSQMIDILTPAGSENSEIARNNYKVHVAKATNWLELGIAVFDFESNPDWTNMESSLKQQALNDGFSDAVDYRYCGNVPDYFTH